MATTQQGRNWRWSFGVPGTGETFSTLGGEKTWDFTANSQDIDTSDKDGPSGVLIPGRIKVTISGNIKLPDAGLSVILAASQSGAYIDAKLNNGAIVKFASSVSVGNPKVSGPVDGTVTYSFDLANADVPTTYALDAAA